MKADDYWSQHGYIKIEETKKLHFTTLGIISQIILIVGVISSIILLINHISENMEYGKNFNITLIVLYIGICFSSIIIWSILKSLNTMTINSEIMKDELIKLNSKVK